MDARYLRVKNWTKFQHYKDRHPIWIKFHWRDLKNDHDFCVLTELEQWQLVRIWGFAANSSTLTLDEQGKAVPVIPYEEKTIRRGIETATRVPLEKFVRAGWLIMVAEHELMEPVLADDASAVASTVASALLGSRDSRDSRTKTGFGLTGLKGVA